MQFKVRPAVLADGEGVAKAPAPFVASLIPPSRSEGWAWAALLAVAFLAAVGFGVWRYLAQRKVRVFVAASSTTQQEDGLTSAGDTREDETQAAEARLQEYPCIVITTDKQRADFIVNISIQRYSQQDLSGNWAYANLSVSKGTGEVVLMDSFSQNRDSTADIAQMPPDRAAQFLCKFP